MRLKPRTPELFSDSNSGHVQMVNQKHDFFVQKRAPVSTFCQVHKVPKVPKYKRATQAQVIVAPEVKDPRTVFDFSPYGQINGASRQKPRGHMWPLREGGIARVSVGGRGLSSPLSLGVEGLPCTEGFCRPPRRGGVPRRGRDRWTRRP